MKKQLLITLFTLSSSFVANCCNAQLISTIAGNGIPGWNGDGGQATAAEIYNPNAVGFDHAGNIYIVDEGSFVVRKVDMSGIITTIAGNGIQGFSGDGGQATNAEFSYLEGVWGDKKGNVYIADEGNRRIRKVHTTGKISTFAGNGTFGYTGDGGPATAAELGTPYRIAIDTADNVYIADQGENVIRKVDTTGIISTVAGNGNSGFSGDGGQATVAEIKYPYGISVDIPGNIYIADCGNNRIREVSTTGIITTVAGNGIASFSGDGGQATAAELYGPFGVAADAFGNIYIDDQTNVRIRAVNPLGIITTIAGTGANGYNGDGIPATAAQLNFPWDVSVDAAGNVYISDEANQRVRIISGLTTGVSVPENKQSVLVYPNPNNGIFNVFCHSDPPAGGEESLSLFEVYNMLGKKVFTETLRNIQGSNTIDLSTQPAGIYLYRVINDYGTSASGKIVIE